MRLYRHASATVANDTSPAPPQIRGDRLPATGSAATANGSVVVGRSEVAAVDARLEGVEDPVAGELDAVGVESASVVVTGWVVDVVDVEVVDVVVVEDVVDATVDVVASVAGGGAEPPRVAVTSAMREPLT